MPKTSVFRLNSVPLAVCICCASGMVHGQVAEPYPALPPTLSTSVTPNVLLHIDNSGSMGNRPAGSPSGTESKMESARTVAKDLINKNQKLRWGVFSFNPDDAEKAGVLQAPIANASEKQLEILTTAIDGLGPDTWTPLGEAMFEMTRYFAGETSYYTSKLQYTSPIQYRCQKNFVIVLTDGEATKDNKLPGVAAAVGGAAAAGITYQAGLDSSNKPISKEFKVCTDQNTTSSVSCPANLEGAGVGNTFSQVDGTNYNYPRSLRDVAMYASDRDFKVSKTGDLTDGDGVTWDDTSFLKQSLTTYTVGFDLTGSSADAANRVLKAAATVGKGEYYAAANKAQLASSLQNAVDSIVASISNAGGLAAKAVDSFTDNVILQPVFNPNGWYGELRCFSITSAGKLGNPCSPNAKAKIPQPTASDKNGRNVFTSNRPSGTSSDTVAFNFDEAKSNMDYMTSAQKSALGTTDAEQIKTIKFVRGIEGISGFRSRFNTTLNSTVLLGDIVDGVPTVVARPEGYSPDTAFTKFATDNVDRSIVLVGANDGMLHAFRLNPSTPNGTDNMTEMMGYIPSSVYPRLKSLTSPTYGQSGGTPHTYHVNGNMQKESVKMGVSANEGGAWKTLVVGGLGQGGQGIFAIDASSATNFSEASKTVKWEFTDVNDSDMGYVMGTPSIYNVRTAGAANAVTPAVIVANGFENDWSDGSKAVKKSSALFIIEAATGKLLKKISLPESYGSNGLATAAGYDVGGDGIVDYVYAGDVNGKMWRFDLTSNTPDGFKVASKPIFDAGSSRPITQRPAILRALGGLRNDVNRGLMVYFGTGQLLKNTDRLDTATQSFYGVLDNLDATPTTILDKDLQQQTVVNTKVVAPVSGGQRAGTYRQLSDNEIDLFSNNNSKKGWFINFPDSSERLVNTPLLLTDRIVFGTGVTKSTMQCTPGGSGWIMGLNPFTGSVVRKNNKATEAAGKAFSFVDLTGDERSTVDDKVQFGTTSSTLGYISAYQTPGIPTELTSLNKTISFVEGDPSKDQSQELGRIVALREVNAMGVFRDSVGAILRSPKTQPPACPTMHGTIGSDGIQVICQTGAGGDAARLVKSTWREIK